MSEQHPNQSQEQLPEQVDSLSLAEQYGLTDGEFNVRRTSGHDEAGWSLAQTELRIVEPGEKPQEFAVITKYDEEAGGNLFKSIPMERLMSWQEPKADILDDDTIPRDKLKELISAPESEHVSEAAPEAVSVKNTYGPEIVTEIRSEINTLEGDIQQLETELTTEVKRFLDDSGQLSQELRSSVTRLEDEVSVHGRNISGKLYDSINRYMNIHSSLEYGDADMGSIVNQAEALRNDVEQARRDLDIMQDDIQRMVAGVRGSTESGTEQVLRSSSSIGGSLEELDYKTQLQKEKLKDLTSNMDDEQLHDEYTDHVRRDIEKFQERDKVRSTVASLSRQYREFSEALAYGELEKALGVDGYTMEEMKRSLDLIERQLGDMAYYGRSMNSSQIAANYGHDLMAHMRNLQGNLQGFATNRQNFSERIPQI